jgi:hypothetical protein
MTGHPVYVEEKELTVRIAEACMGNRRPEGMGASEALDSLYSMDADAAAGFTRAALAAAEYIAECVNAIYPGSVEIKRFPEETKTTQ